MPYCSGAEGAFAPASAISVIAINVRARVAWSGGIIDRLPKLKSLFIGEAAGLPAICRSF